MKRFTKTAMLGAAVGAVLVSQSAQAGFTVNDLYLGFTQSSASSDLIIDLGQASSLIGASSVVDLSSDLAGLSTFNSTFNTSANGVGMAVVGGDNVFGSFGVFATQVRSGGAGTAAIPGSSLTATPHSSSAMSGGASAVSAIMSSVVGGLPTAGNQASDTTKSYSATEVNGATTFLGKTGVQPAGTIGSSGIMYEDLWAATTTKAYTYEGFFTFNYGADSLTFTPASLVVSAVPEPGMYGVMAGAGLLVLSVRRQFSRKTV